MEKNDTLNMMKNFVEKIFLYTNIKFIYSRKGLQKRNIKYEWLFINYSNSYFLIKHEDYTFSWKEK